MSQTQTIEKLNEFINSAEDLSRLCRANSRLGIAVDPGLANRCVDRFEKVRGPVRELIKTMEASATSVAAVEFASGNVAARDDENESSTPRM